MHRVVLDTNVLVSAVIAEGKPRELLNQGIEGPTSPEPRFDGRGLHKI